MFLRGNICINLFSIELWEFYVIKMIKQVIFVHLKRVVVTITGQKTQAPICYSECEQITQHLIMVFAHDFKVLMMEHNDDVRCTTVIVLPHYTEIY